MLFDLYTVVRRLLEVSLVLTEALHIPSASCLVHYTSLTHTPHGRKNQWRESFLVWVGLCYGLVKNNVCKWLKSVDKTHGAGIYLGWDPDSDTGQRQSALRCGLNIFLKKIKVEIEYFSMAFNVVCLNNAQTCPQ